jgi:hypothetical protein
MSLIARVTDLIVDLGDATVDDLLPYLEGYARRQVINAMQNAASNGLVHVKGPARRLGGGRGSAPSRYYPGPGEGRRAAQRRIHRDIHTRPPASVWELAHSLQIPGTWPPVATPGRKFAPLGPWNEEGAAA